MIHLTYLTAFILVVTFSIVYSLLKAKENANFLNDRKDANDDWHLSQFITRAFVIVGFIAVLPMDWVNKFFLLIVAIPISWIFFDQSLNLFRTLTFLHKGKKGIDMLFESELLFFVFKCICLVGAISLYCVTYF